MRSEPMHTNGERPKKPSPYAVSGSGELGSFIWKHGREESGWRYRFNIFRLAPGEMIRHSLRPEDLPSLMRLVRVLAQVLVDDGCLLHSLRQELAELAIVIDGAERFIESIAPESVRESEADSN